jgi:ATP-binding cassette, subfamily B, bacterial
MAAEPVRGWRGRLAALATLRHGFRLIWNAAPRTVVGILALRTISALLPLSGLWVSKRLIDAVVGTTTVGPPATAPEIWLLLGLGLTLSVLASATGRTTDYFEGRLADAFSRDVSLRVMRQAASLELAWFENAAFHDRLERARAQATDRIMLLSSLGALFQRSGALVSMSAGVAYYEPLLLVLVVLCVVPTFVGESHFALLGYGLAHRLTPRHRELDYLRLVGSSRESAKEVKMFDLGPHLAERYGAISDEVIEENKRLARQRLGWGTLLAALATLGYYGGYAYLVWQAFAGRISVGTLTFLAGALATAQGELAMVFSLVSSISEHALFLTDLISFLELRSPVESKPDAVPVPRPIRRGLEFRNVSFTYPGTDRLVLRDLDFHIAPGERVALVGENGNGKTTFVKLIARLYEPTSGSILLDGVDLRDYRIDDLRREIGVIFQDFFRYDMAVRTNIGVGRLELAGNDEALWEAARKSGADQMLAGLPRGLEQMLGRRFEGGVDLSGGEWQSVALARAYLRDAQLLILDEPTASLDAIAEAEAFASFAELTRGRMAILISHRFSTVRIADRIVVLAGGRIQEEGSHEELVAAGGRYAHLYETQASSYR